MRWLAADSLEHGVGIPSSVHARDDYEDAVLKAIEDLKWEAFDQTPPRLTVEDLARFRKAQDDLEGFVNFSDELSAKTGALGFVPLEGDCDIAFRSFEEPDQAYRLSRQGVP
jgi:hypothetical protein